MSEAELKELEVEFMTAIPGEDDLAQMPERERRAVESKVMESAANMVDKMMDEPMPAAVEPVVASQGQFQDADSVHRGSCTATIINYPMGPRCCGWKTFP
jgi:hypothetical protein